MSWEEDSRTLETFLAAWPPERVRDMTLEEYTNPDKDDAFIYWLEARLEKHGSIWGSPAFKFGVYHRDDTEPKEPSGGRIWGDTYAWRAKYGATAQAAFATVRARLVDVIEAAESGGFERIDEIDLAPTVKWKVAFLYQDPENPGVFPIFKRDALFHHYQAIDPTAKRSSTAQSVMYATLLGRHRDIGDPTAIASSLWSQWKTDHERALNAWVLPVGWLDAETVELLCSHTVVEPEDIDGYLENLLAGAELSAGDHLVVLVDGDVRAVGELLSTDPGEFSWRQTPVEFPSGLLVNPTSEVKKLSAAEWQEISAKMPGEWKPSTEQEPKKEPPARPCEPKNIILFGPPGTGKTYSTVRRALELILGADKLKGLSDRALTVLFRDHQSRGQIEFITFHQAYGYEEFVEGLRPVLDDDEGKDVRYELHDGVFKRIALRAAAEGLRAPSAAPEFDSLWGRLVDEVSDEHERLVQSQSGKSYVLRVSSRGNFNTYPCQVDDEGNVNGVADKIQTASAKNSKLLWEQRDTFGVQPENLTYQKAVEIFEAGNHYTALWMVYKELLTLSRQPSSHKERTLNSRSRVQQVLDKSSAGVASFGFSSRDRQYVLIIDEINRGNVGKILGELITLLEPDKRLGTRNELKLPLSYSPEHRFAVPPNLHILGTMNTADRSIALMDVALRRRFTFEELMPRSDVIRRVLRGEVADMRLIELTIELFETLNARIRFLYDRDHQLGHSFFLGIRSIDDLRRQLVDCVIPLLQEYFYGAWDKICMVLGCPYNESGVPSLKSAIHGHLLRPESKGRKYLAPFINAEVFNEKSTLGFDHADYEDRVDYSVNRRFPADKPDDHVLMKALLGILQLDKTEFDTHLSALSGTEHAEEAP